MNTDCSRRTFLLGGLATGAVLMAGSGLLKPGRAEAAPAEAVMLEECVSMTPEEMAKRSAYVMAAWRYLQDSAAELKDPALRATVEAILKNPAPLLAKNDEKAIMTELKAQGLLKADAKALFPECADAAQSPQPFYTAPGSGWNSHHSYPGGLVTHTALNVASCKALYDNYVKVYGLELDRDVVLASQMLHDLHKPWVFQWQKDGSCRTEQTLAATGEHHTLSVAESLRRGLSPELCVAQACAHDHPGSEASEKTVVGWLKAAAVINGKDAATIGLLEKDGKTLPMPRRIEGFVTHLADHDWVISVPAAQWTVSALRQVAARVYGLKESDLKARPFNQFRNYVLSQKTAMQLYGAYAAKGMDGLTAEVAQVERA